MSENLQVSLENNSVKKQIKLSFRSLRYDREKQVKLGLITICTILIGLDSQLGIFSFQRISDSCFIDKWGTITRPIYRVFKNNSIFRNFISMLSSLTLDIIMIYSSIRWIFFSKEWRLGVGTLNFYAVRALVQSLYIMKFSDEYFWEAPPIKSIVVNYLKTNDYFFSGHVGFPIIAAQEFLLIHQIYFAIPCFLISALQMFVVTIARTHYSIDIFTGLYVAHYILIITDYWEQFFLKKYSKKNYIALDDLVQEELLPSEKINGSEMGEDI